MMYTWSRESMPTPITEPRIQWFGSGFGHIGSTSKRGASTIRDAAAACSLD
jgi:hypothetical protein